jgi:hypothetical protein
MKPTNPVASAARPSMRNGSMEPIDRDETIRRIRMALKQRSGRAWSVSGGRGTSWGWISIDTTPKRSQDPITRDADRAELSRLLGFSREEGKISVPASSAYRHEYIARAEGREPDILGEPYWD